MIPKKTEIIAEIANAHQGNWELAIEIAHKAVEAGAHAIKFQVYTADDLMVPTHPRYEHFKKQSFSETQWNLIFDKVKNLPVKKYADVFGFESLNMIIHHNVDGYKIHFSDLVNAPLIDEISKLNKTIFIGTGGAYLNEIEYAVNRILNQKTFYKDIVVMHGYQNYPTDINDTNLNRLITLKTHFKDKIKLGISEHTEGSSEYAILIPLFALNMGVEYIEKHITINRHLQGVDYYSSVEPDLFNKLVLSVEQCEKIMGTEKFEFSPEEQYYRDSVKKKWVANTHIQAGETISNHHVVSKRYSGQASTLLYEDIIGKVLKKEKNNNDEFNNNDFI